MRLFNFTIIKLTLCLSIGIVLGYVCPICPSAILISLSILFLVLISIVLTTHKRIKKTVGFGILSFLIFILIGASTVSIHNQIYFESHYTKSIKDSKGALSSITFSVREVLKSSDTYSKYIIEIHKINGKNAKGRSLLNMKRESDDLGLDVDDCFMVKSSFNTISPPLNPNQFDYKSYLQRRYIYHQIFVEKGELYKLQSETPTIRGFANSIRKGINTKLKTYDFNSDQLAVINALLLGQRRDISEEVYTNYVNSGAVHILAVSGLHVGIILILLNFLFKPVEYFKYGKLIKTIIILSLLWSFALIAGFSPSVTRAVTMFSIIAIAMGLKRPTNIYNTLAISAFVILLFKPLFLFDVGFQLSYAAVFSIVAIDPIFYKIWQPKNRILDIYWHTLTVTVAAQIGVLPISLYYFHQFTALFFISNLVIIPFLGLVLGFGIIVILLAVLNILPDFIASLFGSIISAMNVLVEWVSGQNSFIMQDIYFSSFYVLVFYFLIISFFRLVLRRNYRSLTTVLLSIVLVQGAYIYTKISSNKNQFIIFHRSGQTLIADKNNGQLVLSSGLDSLDALSNHILKNYRLDNRIDKFQQGELQSLYVLNKNKVLIIDSLGIYKVNSFRPDFVLLTQSPKINLNRLIDSIQPQQIIADGSNYKSTLEYWKVICEKRKLPFHNTYEKGAFIIDY